MSERSGLGPVELAVLAASDTTAGGFRRCSDVLADVLADIALGPAYAYPLLCDLARPWKLLDPLIEASGNFGSQGNDPAASPQYTECRPSELGVLTLAVEARAVPALPMWLVIGDLHAGGVRPPLPLGAVVTALERLLADPTAGLDDLFWPVVFPGGAAVDGDREAFLAGEPTTLRLDAKIIIEQTPRGPRRLLVSVPYDVNVDELVQRLADQGRMWRDRDRFPRVGARAFAPVLDVQDESTLRTGLRIAVRLDEDAPDAEGLLQAVWGVHRMVDVRVPGGPGGALRAWFAAHAEAGLPAAVALLRDVAEGRGAGRVRHVAGPERWTPPPPSAAVVAEWASTGLAPGEIGPLLSADGELTPQEWQAFVDAGLAEVAETWIALGFAADEARSWTDAGVWPYEARVWRASGLMASDVPPIEDRALPVLPPGGAYGWTAYVPLEPSARRYGAVDPPGTRGREARRSPDGRRGGRSIGD